MLYFDIQNSKNLQLDLPQLPVFDYDDNTEFTDDDDDDFEGDGNDEIDDDIRGHPFIMSTRVRERGKPHVNVHTEN